LKTKGIYFLYRTLQAFALPLLLFYFLFRGCKNRGYWRSLPQRLGSLPRPFTQTNPGAVWLHAVSVGEVLSCVEFLRRLRAEFPHSGLYVSTTTLAGHATATAKLRDIVDGVFYAPVDYVFAVRRVLRALQPALVLIAETEIWPNLFREVKRTNAALAIVNGRVSDGAFARYRRWDALFHAVLPHTDSILAQTPAIAERFLALGAPPGRVRVTGNFKYDFEPRAAGPDSPVIALIDRLRPNAVWIAASTMPPAGPGDVDEDDAVIAAYRELARPDLLLILVPRKPERFDVVAKKLEAAGIPYVRRSTLAGQANVLLLDTMGELSGLFAVADLVFMGGTLAQRGGHNVLEPALFGKPVVVGPHMENFQAIADDFRAAGAWVEIAGAAALAEAIRGLLDRPADARAIGDRGKACAEARSGATARALDEARTLYASHVPCYRPAEPWFAIRWALSRVWKWGGRRRQARFLARRRRLDAPVVSVGNITMGGTGKTPCVLRLAELLKASGRRPGILTRGYGRGSPDKVMAIAPGAAVRAEHSGDEPQIFVRSGLAPVGIGGDRYEAGALLLRQFDVDLLLLDDGFQHVRLARNVDIVLVDALQPFGGGGLFPLGRLREPLEALARAGIVLITRSRFSDLVPAIEHEVRRYNPAAPIFHGYVEPRAWVEHRTGREFPVDARPFERAGAFCGLGNPQSFRRTLMNLGVDPVGWIEFEDHHRYRPHEVVRLAGQMRSLGAGALVTTEKDAVNLCADCNDLAEPLVLYWLKVAMGIDDEDEFLAAVLRLLAHDLPLPK
jgi:3-deoxy-D-manno-octulosonic-acid transferase